MAQHTLKVSTAALVVGGFIAAATTATVSCDAADTETDSGLTPGTGGTGNAGGTGATGGTEAAAGAGGSAGQADGSTWWLTRETGWNTADEAAFAKHCDVATADSTTVPQLTWSGSSPEVLGLGALGSAALSPVVSIRGTEPEVHGSWVTAHIGDKAYQARAVFDLRFGQSLGAVRMVTSASNVYAPCVLGYPRESAVAMEFSAGADPITGEGTTKVAALTARTDGWVWGTPAVSPDSIPPGRLTADAADGTRLLVGQGVVAIMRDPGNQSWDVLESPSGSHRGAGAGSVIAWTDYAEPQQRIRGWRGKGVETLLDPAPETTCIAAATDEHLFGVSATSAAARCGGPVTDVRMWRAAVSGGNVEQSPPLVTGSALIHSVRAWGDHVGVALTDTTSAGIPTSEAYLLVARTTDWKRWTWRPPAGNEVSADAWAIGADYVYVGVGKPPSRELVRLERTRLDQLGTVFQEQQ